MTLIAAVLSSLVITSFGAKSRRSPQEQELKIKDVNENFSKQVEDLQKLYEGYMKDKEAAEAALKGQG